MEKIRVTVIKKKFILVIQQAATIYSEQIKEGNMGKTSPMTTTEQQIREEIQTFPPSNTFCAGFTAGIYCLVPTALMGGTKPFQEVFQLSDSVFCIIVLTLLPGSHKGQVQFPNH